MTTAPPGERAAEALAEVCGWVLDHAPTSLVPDAGGFRPQVNVVVRLEDLENRARAAVLDFGGVSHRRGCGCCAATPRWCRS